MPHFSAKKIITYTLILAGIFINQLGFANNNAVVSVESKMSQMNISLPKPSVLAGDYVSLVRSGNMIFVSGNLPMSDDGLQFVGKLGNNVSEGDGVKAAELAALNIVSQLKNALGSLDKVKRCIKITGFVNSTPDFTNHPKIIDGASNIIVKLFGDKGKHARAAIGVSSLPFGSSVEVEAIFEVE